MTSTGQWPLQAAIYTALTADSTLMSLITGVYDFIPENVQYPYVALGDALGADASNLATPGMRFALSLMVYSQQGGRAEAATILDRIATLLSGVSLSVSGQTLVYLHLTGSSITLNKDGVTYMGTLKMAAVLQG